MAIAYNSRKLVAWSDSMKRMATKSIAVFGLALVGLVGCGGPLEEGPDALAAEQALLAPADPSASEQSQAQGTNPLAGTSATRATTAPGQVNLPNKGNVSDSQDPIPITQDDRPVSGGGSTGPQPNDPEALRLNGFLRR